MKKTLLIFGLFIGFTGIKAQIVNEGTLKIEPGTSVYFGNDFTNKSTATYTNDGNLHVKGNFTNNGTVNTTAAATGTTFFNSSATTTQNIYVTDGTNLTEFNNLTVNNSATNGESLAVSDNVSTDDGVNFVVKNKLHIQDNQKLRLMGNAQLIQTHSGLTTNTGNGHLLKDQKGAENAYRYNYWSSPVQNNSGTTYKLGTVLKDGTTPDQWTPAQVNFTAGLNGNQNSPIEISTRWLWKYLHGSIDPWNDIGWLSLYNLGTTTESSNTNMNPGEGFCMKGTDPSASLLDTQNYSFEGKPNDGDYTLSIGDNEEYLVGNPYPSALDANQFLSDNSTIIDQTIWFWDHWSLNTHYYTSYGAGYMVYTPGSGAVAATRHFHFTNGTGNGTKTLPANYKIPVGQGFIVRSATSGANGGTLTFKNSQRVFDVSSEVNKNNQYGDILSKIRLGYEGPSNNLRHRFLLLALTELGTDAYDEGYEAEMIDIDKNDMYFTISGEGNNSPYCIQGVGSYNIDAEYPLVVKMTDPGRHFIMIDELENFDEPIYILDKYGAHNLRENDYMILTEIGQTQRNLKLVFKPQTTSHVQDYLNDFVHAFYAQEEIIIHNDKNLSLTGMQVYNSLGQLVYQIDEAGRLAGAIIHLPFAGYAQTAYIIKLQAKSGNGTYKFINY